MLAAGLLGVRGETNAAMITIFVPKDTYLGDVLEFLAAANTPIRNVTTYTDGWDISVNVAPVEQGRILSKATSRNLVVGGRQRRPVPAENTVRDYSELMSGSIDEINAFIDTYDLEVADYRAMLAYEERHKKRSTMIRDLLALLER